MFKRIAALTFIFGCTAFAWLILGATIYQRTYSQDRGLREKVASSWGTPQAQSAPTAGCLTLDSSRVDVGLRLEQRQKGLLWYNTYKVDFAGRYVFRNLTGKDENVMLVFKPPAAQAIYDDLTLLLNGQPVTMSTSDGYLSAPALVPAGQAATLAVSYRSQGQDHWTYDFGGKVAQIHDFELSMRTNFRDIDFPDNTLSPTDKEATRDGWKLTWHYSNLVSGVQIGMRMPEKLQPGPLAGQISYFAPVSLLFFFFVVFIITTIRGIDLHPMNYFFLAAAFFAFHLLLAYLVDHISIHLAFAISSLVSIFLVISYLRLAVGLRFAAVEAGISQLVYLVLFSYAFFFKGFTGLTVTIGAVITLFVVMQLTGRIRWAEKFAGSGAAIHARG